MNFENPELLDNILQNPQQAMRLAMILRQKNKQVPDNVLDSLVGDSMMGSNFARTLAQDYILTGEDVPPQLLQAVSQHPKDAYYLAKYYKEHNQRVPEIVFQAIKNSQYFSQFQSGLSDEDEEKTSSFQSDFLKKILQDSNMTLRYVAALLKKNQPVPEHAETAIESFNDANVARHYAAYLTQHAKPVNEKIYKIVAQDPQESFALATEVLHQTSKIVENMEIIKSLAKSSEHAGAYGIALLNKRIINQKILKLLEDSISKSKFSKKHKSAITSTDTAEKLHEKAKSEEAGQYATVYARVLGDLPNESLTKLVKTKYLTYIAINLLAHGKTIPSEIVDKIANDPPRAFAFVAQYKLGRGSKPLPPDLKKIKIAADKYEKETI